MFFIAVWIIVAAEKDEARPNKKLEGRFIIMEVGPDGEPIAPEAAAKKFIRQSGCTVRDHIPISIRLWKASNPARNGMRYPKEKKNGAGGSLRKTSRFQLNPKRYASARP